MVPAAFGIIVRDPPPSPNDYKYSYDIQDPTTGDSKSQHEVRQGDVVTGAYTVVGPDGTKRTVEYTADAKHGFKAVVSEEPGTPPVTQPPVTYHQPILHQPVSPHYNEIQYHSAPRPVYTPVLQDHPKINYIEEKPQVYFTPRNEIVPESPYENGHYFIPANGHY